MESFQTHIEFSESLRTELRRKVNDSRKAKAIDASVVPISGLRTHDTEIILGFLLGEFSLPIVSIWEKAQLSGSWLALQDWDYPGIAIVEREDIELGEWIEPLISKGQYFIISHSGLYSAKMSLIKN